MKDEIFHQIIDAAQDCIFWKDDQRRFAGVNRAFLEFYGFPGEDVLIGRNDEEMGWHSDPGPFQSDELRVLEGKSTYRVHGKCVVKGEERDIVASKRPLYEDGRIVGLVGSFSDVTDYMKKRTSRGRDASVYTEADLRRYPFFDRIPDRIRPGEMLDPLTGVVSRGYMLDFARSLIAEGTPFSFSIIDLDNFKYINDTYGHRAGDLVLMDIAGKLAAHTKGYGVVGRYGGDELLLINFRDVTYDERKAFFEELYGPSDVLRKEIAIDDFSIFVTATAGCVACPGDAGNYDDLFMKMDKVLYRGKDKGRNCYIIYVEEKHRDLEIRKIARRGIQANMQSIIRRLESGNSFESRLQTLWPFLKSELRLSAMYYVDREGILHDPADPGIVREVKDISDLMTEEIFADHTLENIRQISPALYAALADLGTEAVLIAAVGTGSVTDGYLICAVSQSQRLWQENECGLIYFLAKELAARMRLDEAEKT